VSGTSTPSERPRLLFSSYHCCLDPSSGAAIATRDLLELLARHGWGVRVFCGPVLDVERREPFAQWLTGQGIGFQERPCDEGPVPFSLFHFFQGRAPATVFMPRRPGRAAPSLQDGAAFLAVYQQVLDDFQPHVLLTYGGHAQASNLMARARRRGAAVVFALHNLEYRQRRLFQDASAVLVPSQFCAEHYLRTLALDCTAIPSPLDWSRVRCDRDPARQYVTFVNPQPNKGVFVFARIAHELGTRRPDIPLLVVEGRGGVDWLSRTGLDLSGLKNLNVMANTPDPRDFYRVSRVVLMPSLGKESFGRVAAEAMINGIPVLVSGRGALPEVVRGAGFVFDIPERYTPVSRIVPAAGEVSPWVETVIRLWDDAALFEAESRRALAAAEAWRPERLVEQYDAFFRGLLGPRGSKRR
jgi:glycosyltransferase involved in cell wall biosynthesis